MGTTLPFDPRTFPNLTDTQRIPFCGRDDKINSHVRLVAPIMFDGFTALSEEIITKFLQPTSSASPTKDKRPRTLFLTASWTLDSISGTCLYAAAWKRISGLTSDRTRRTRSQSVTSATQKVTWAPFWCLSSSNLR